MTVRCILAALAASLLLPGASAAQPGPFDGGRLDGERLTVRLPAKSLVVLELR